jgi:hypothetical protein
MALEGGYEIQERGTGRTPMTLGGGMRYKEDIRQTSAR